VTGLEMGEDMCLDVGILGEEDSADIGVGDPEFWKEQRRWCSEEEEEKRAYEHFSCLSKSRGEKDMHHSQDAFGNKW
jgi:hypothetical protein